MRRRLSRMTAAGVVVVVLGAGAVAAQSAGGGGTTSGGNGNATGHLLGPEAAEVVVQTSGTPGGGAPGGVGSGGGGGGSDITCSLGWPSGQGGAEGATLDVLTGLHEEQGPVPVIRTCFDENGTLISSELIEWSPAEGGDGPALVDPAVLAEMARERMSWPLPTVMTSPPLEQGTYAQLSTFFHVDNWAPVTSPPATAGGAWATVTGAPVSQSWVIQDTYRGTLETVTCDGPGALYDKSLPFEAQTPACGWTPAHSSDGQTQTSPQTGEPCFPATVTLTWDVSWASNVAAGGPLGQGTSTTLVCLVVAELQATVVAAP